MENPFKAMESDETCPPHLKTAIVSEIDLIRNALRVLDLYSNDLFNTIAGAISGLTDER